MLHSIRHNIELPSADTSLSCLYNFVNSCSPDFFVISPQVNTWQNWSECICSKAAADDEIQWKKNWCLIVHWNNVQRRILLHLTAKSRLSTQSSQHGLWYPLVIIPSYRLNSCSLRAFSVLSPRLWNSSRLLCDNGHNITSFGHSLDIFLSEY